MGNQNGRTCGSIGTEFGRTGFSPSDSPQNFDISIALVNEAGVEDETFPIRCNKGDNLGQILATFLSQSYNNAPAAGENMRRLHNIEAKVTEEVVRKKQAEYANYRAAWACWLPLQYPSHAAVGAAGAGTPLLVDSAGALMGATSDLSGATPETLGLTGAVDEVVVAAAAATPSALSAGQPGSVSAKHQRNTQVLVFIPYTSSGLPRPEYKTKPTRVPAVTISYPRDTDAPASTPASNVVVVAPAGSAAVAGGAGSM